MQLVHVPLDQLSISAANMRATKKAPDVSDILPSVRSRGVITPLLVRPNGAPDRYEVVAGRRRYYAATAAAEGAAEYPPLPCAVLEEGDDAAALEASLIENVVRVAPDEVTQWVTFTRLARKGRSIEEVAATFAMSELRVRRILALGNLLPRLRKLYAKEKIDASTVRHLTLASREQQNEWLALYDSPEAYAPRGHQLKQWLFGGQAIPTKAALFQLDQYTGGIVTDLFGEDSYFADAKAFWELQQAAIDAKRQSYLDAGWTAVKVLEPGQRFEGWNHVKRPRTRGGKVYIEVSARGDVGIHEGYLPEKEARRNDRPVEETPRPKRPEISSTLRNYLDLHRHAAVRAKLLDHPQVALRVMVAHAITSSPLWNVRADPQRADKEATAESVETSPSETAFDEARRRILANLGMDAEEPTVVGGVNAPVPLMARLLALSDEQVLGALAVVMGETLAVGGEAVTFLGSHLSVDMTQVWQVDAAYLELIRDREQLLSVLRGVAGPSVASQNAAEKCATLRRIISDCVSGENGRTKAEAWVPPALAFGGGE